MNDDTRTPMASPAIPPAPLHHSKSGKLWLVLCAIAVAAYVWFASPTRDWLTERTPMPVESRPAVQADQRPVTARGSLAEDERNNIAVFKAASPAVVNITSLETSRQLLSLRTEQVPKGTGTGFIWDNQGHVVTNFHVILGANAAVVTLSDQTSYKATLIGTFPDRDLAVLRIAAPRDRLTPALIGSSRGLEVGQKVYAIGNPYGLDQTLTTGIVSALNREIESVTQRAIRGVIQTDAAINPGNSGGPLLDSAGRVVGVTTAIYSPSGASAGIGFAIPIDEINRIVPKLITSGKFVRPSLGIQAAPPQFNAALGLPRGVAVVGVTAGSAAQQAGIVPFQRNDAGEILAGDIISAIGETPVQRVDDLLEVLERQQVGDNVRITVVRNGKSQVITVKLKSE